ncbi:MAG: 50S ribosomal protein L10 [Planctomycetaceae bacterium]
MSKVVKELVISEMERRLGANRDVLVIDFSAVEGVKANEVRLALQARGVTLLGVKNSLARKVLGVPGMEKILAGPSTLVWGGEDIVALSKEMTAWAKQVDKLEIKGATVDGQAVDANGVVELSKSPGRVELISQIAGLILSPGARLAAAMLGPGGKLAAQLKTLSTGDGAGEGEASAAEEPATAE